MTYLKVLVQERERYKDLPILTSAGDRVLPVDVALDVASGACAAVWQSVRQHCGY